MTDESAQAIERLSRLYAALSRVSQAMVRSASQEKFLRQACAALTEHGRFLLAWIGRHDRGTQEVVKAAWSGRAAAYLDGAAIYADDRPEGRGPTGTAVREGRPYICGDFMRDPRTAPWHEASARHGIRASAAFPLKLRGEVWGALSAYSGEAGFFRDREIHLLEAASVVSFALEHLEGEVLRREAEAALRESEARLRQVMDGLGQHMFVGLLDAQGTVLLANRPALEAAGLRPEEVFGKPVAETYWWTWSDRVSRRLRAAVERAAHGEPVRYDEQIRAAEGRMIWVDFSIQPLRDQGGRIAFLIPSAQVITERKQAEEKLRLSEERFSAAFHVGPAGMTITRVADGKFIEVNASFLGMFEFSRDEVIGHTSTELNMISLEERGRLIQQQRESGGVRCYDLLARSKSGRPIHLLLSSTPMDVDGEACLITTLIDVTDRKRAEAEREKLQAQLIQTQKMESVGRLAGGVAHDFNNLLTVINGYTEVLLAKAAQDDPARRPLEEIAGAGERAASLTRQLLAFGRKQALNPRILDLNAIVSGMEKMLRRLIGEDIVLAVTLEPALGSVKADPGQLEQVLMNLAVNSRDAMPRGGKLMLETRNVALERECTHGGQILQPGRYVELSVADTGVGMGEETKNRLFEPFFTTKDVGKGTGLGLSMVYGIIKQSEGHIWVQSEPGRGATFRIFLPRIEALPEAALPRSAAPVLRGSETILLAEDSDPVRRLAREVLQDQGYRVLETSDGKSALERAEKHEGTIHLLVTDLVMPGMTGRELAALLAATRPEIKILYMSGYSEEAVLGRSMYGAAGLFISKPFTPGELSRKVREALGLSS